MGQTRAPGHGPRVFTVRSSEHLHACLCVLAVSKSGTSIFVVGGRRA